MDPKALALYSNLHLDLFANGIDMSRVSSSMSITSASSPREAAAIALKRSLLKKFKADNCDLADSRALLKFLSVNKAVRDWELQLPSLEDKILFGELRRAVYEFWNPRGLPLVSNYWDILDFGRCGPGSSVSGNGGDEYTKMYSSPLSCTSEFLYYMYKRYLANNPETESAERQRYSDFKGYKIVAGSRLTFVPKNDNISRCICVEPTLNMFYQLGFGHILERRLSTHFGIEIESQQFKNRELARIGSIDNDLCTIDLESASDSLGLKMLGCVLPKDFMSLLVSMRSGSCDLPGIGRFELDMISTMGNGYTFPLQTVLFASVVIAASRCAGVSLRHPRGSSCGNWGVFGDDIIVPKSILSGVFRLLSILGFRVNSEKSFTEGPFRESCGSDFFQGVNVRGVYIKSLRSMQDRFVAINQLNLFSVRTGIHLRHCIRFLTSLVKWTPVPIWENDDAGIRVPLSLVRQNLRKSRRYQSILYTCYRPSTLKIRICDRGYIVVPAGSKRRKYNPYGLYLCFLRRSINAMTISVRQDTPRYSKKVGVAPNWDQPPTTHPLSGWFPWRRCESAFYLNMFY